MFCGNPRQVADQMEEWFTAPVCDGFVLAATSMPGAYDDAVRLRELANRMMRQSVAHAPLEPISDPSTPEVAAIPESHHRLDLQSSSDVHAVSEDVTVLDYDVAHVDADAELEALVRWHSCIALGHASLHLGRTAQSIHHTAKLDGQPVACCLD
jgi:hypothetical protein